MLDWVTFDLLEDVERSVNSQRYWLLIMVDQNPVLKAIHHCKEGRMVGGGVTKINLPIGSGARQHLIDSDDVEWMKSHADVELVLTAELDQVLVGADTAGFQRLRAELFILVRHEVDA